MHFEFPNHAPAFPTRGNELSRSAAVMCSQTAKGRHSRPPISLTLGQLHLCASLIAKKICMPNSKKKKRNITYPHFITTSMITPCIGKQAPTLGSKPIRFVSVDRNISHLKIFSCMHSFIVHISKCMTRFEMVLTIFWSYFICASFY